MLENGDEYKLLVIILISFLLVVFAVLGSSPSWNLNKTPKKNNLMAQEIEERDGTEGEAEEHLEEEEEIEEEDQPLDGVEEDEDEGGDLEASEEVELESDAIQQSLVSRYRNKSPTNEAQSIADRFLAKMDFNMKSEDLDQPWFHRNATREVANEMLKGKDTGAFLVRPCTQRGCYALSWVKDEAGDISHSLIYSSYPGFSLRHNPDLKERFWSLSSLIENCSYLLNPVVPDDFVANNVHNTIAKTSSEVIGRIIEKLDFNDPNLTELHWKICVLGEGPEYIYNFAKCEKRTFVRYCDEEYAAPELLPLNQNGLALVAQALHNNSTLLSLSITGHEGYLRMNFKPNLADEEAKILARVLQANTNLKSLNVSVNAITDVGAKALAHALKFNKTLLHLNVSQNFITADGLLHLADVLKTNRTIEELSVHSQLHKSMLHVSLACGEKEKTLMTLVDDAIKRRKELLGTVSYSDNTPAVAPLASFHRYLRRPKVERQLSGMPVGSFFFYLNRYLPNQLHVAAVTVDAASKERKIVHKRIHRVRQGYLFAPESQQNRDAAHTGIHTQVPSLFEFCAWYISSKQELLLAGDEWLSEEVKDRVKDVRSLIGLWGMKDAPPTPSLGKHSATEHAHKGGVFPTLLYLVYKNKAWLKRPLSLAETAQQS